MSLDAILYAIIAAFVAWEAVAHFVLHNLSGHTLSNRIGALEHNKAWGWLVRIVVAVAVVVLGVHLEFFP